MATMSYREDNRVKWIGVRPAHGGEQIAKYATANNNTVAIHTVSAGKILYLCSVWTYVDTPQAGFVQVRIDTGGGALWLPLISDHVATSDTKAAQWRTFWPPIEVPSGYVIEVQSTTVNDRSAGIFGWEE